MEIRTTKEALDAALSTISAHKPDQATPAVLFRTKGDSVQAISVSSRMAVCVPLATASTVSGSGQFSIELWRLKQWLGAISGDVTFVTKEGATVASCGKGQVEFPSLPVTDMPAWDAVVDTATSKVTVKASTLRKSFEYAQQFAADKDTTSPNLCVVDVKKGVAKATDGRTMISVEIPGLEVANFRVHVKDVRSVQSFLKTIEGEVTVATTDRAAVYLRPDGGFLAGTKPVVEFPEIKLDPNAAKVKWVVAQADLQSGIQYLQSAAPKDEDRITFTRQGSQVNLTMAAAGGGVTTLPLILISEDSGSFASPFALRVPYISRLISLNQDAEFEFLIHELKPGVGYVQANFKDDCQVVAVALWAT